MFALTLLVHKAMCQWEKDRKEGNIQLSSQEQSTPAIAGDSLEKQLYADIKRLIEQSRGEDPETRLKTLQQADKIQTLLFARLKSSGCYHLTKFLSDEIQKLRQGEKTIIE